MSHFARPMPPGAPVRPARRLSVAFGALALLGACGGGPLDVDLRDLGNGFDTTAALAAAPTRPAPDARGVISYPNYQVVVAQQGDTVGAIAARLGLDADALARYNGILPDTELRRDEVIALPSRVADAGAGAVVPAAATVDVQTLAGDALGRAGDVTTAALPSATPAAAATAAPVPAASPATPGGAEPVRHRVVRGETVYSIARLYGVAARSIAEWNGLDADLTIREGQQLLIPGAGSVRPPQEATVTAPGAGSVAPVPPSASEPLPEPDPAATPQATAAPVATPAPDLGAQQTAPASTARMVQPVAGAIIRAYAPGRNEGIDIGAAAGADVRAAAAGTVAAITTDTAGIQIVVIRHADNLLTVYTHLENLTVARGATVSQGQVIGKVLAGDPTFLHFEVRRGTDSQDPGDFLP